MPERTRVVRTTDRAGYGRGIPEPMPAMVVAAKGRAEILEALDALAVALAGHDHVWTRTERRLYEAALRALGRAL